MFKVNKIYYANKTFRIPELLLKKLESVAQRQDISLNRLIIQCCEYALSHMAPEQNMSTDLPDSE